MADTVRVSQDGDFCIIHDIPDKGVGAAGDEKVDVTVAGQKLANLVMQLGLQKAFLRKSGLDGRRVNQRKERAIRSRRFLSAF